MNSQMIGTGRLYADPELRFTPNGKAVVELRVMFSNSSKKRGEDHYTYSPTMWVSITLWDTMAQNAAEILRGGDDLLCGGVLEVEQYEAKDGSKRDKMVLKMAEVAPSIRRKVPFVRDDTNRSAPPPARQQQARTQARPQPVHAAPVAGLDDEPPF